MYMNLLFSDFFFLFNRSAWNNIPQGHMSDYSDDEETEESASLLPAKEQPHSHLTARANSPYVNYDALPVSPKQTPTNQVLSNGYEQIGNDDTDTSSIPSSESSAGFSFFALPRKQKLILASVCMADFLSYLCLSLLAPFFPQEVRNVWSLIMVQMLTKHIDITGSIFHFFISRFNIVWIWTLHATLSSCQFDALHQHSKGNENFS